MSEQGRVFVRLLGGMGNQLFQYAFGLALAQTTGRALVFDRTMLDADRQRTYVLDRWGVNVPFERPPRAAQAVLAAPGAWRLARRLGGRVRLGGTLLVWDRMRGEPVEIGAGVRDVVLTGYWQQAERFAGVAEELRRTLAPRKADAFDEAARRAGIGPGTVAVHVRRGDYVRPGVRDMTPPLPPRYYEDALRRIGERFPASEVLLLSDDLDWAQRHLRLPLAVRTADPPLPPEGDLWLMGRCPAVVIANSSFSWWGAWLAEGRRAIVAAPEPWFGPRGSGFAHPAPPSWLRVSWQA